MVVYVISFLCCAGKSVVTRVDSKRFGSSSIYTVAAIMLITCLYNLLKSYIKETKCALYIEVISMY